MYTLEPEAAAPFEVCVGAFKFNAAHFVAFPGFRERLHGHNYAVAVRLRGAVSDVDGYVLDFGDIKARVATTATTTTYSFSPSSSYYYSSCSDSY